MARYRDFSQFVHQDPGSNFFPVAQHFQPRHQRLGEISLNQKEPAPALLPSHPCLSGAAISMHAISLSCKARFCKQHMHPLLAKVHAGASPASCCLNPTTLHPPQATLGLLAFRPPKLLNRGDRCLLGEAGLSAAAAAAPAASDASASSCAGDATPQRLPFP
jgi:hypothetical protein